MALPTISMFILTCEKRGDLAIKTIERMRLHSDIPFGPTIVQDRAGIEDLGLECSHGPTRATMGHLACIKKGFESGSDYFIVFEDDVTLNRHFWANVRAWPIMGEECGLQVGSFYRMSGLGHGGSIDNCTLIMNRGFYGAQAYVMSHHAAKVMIDHWHEFDKPGDLRIPAIANKYRLLFVYHKPSLVQHDNAPTLATDNRVGDLFAEDFDPNWLNPEAT